MVGQKNQLHPFGIYIQLPESLGEESLVKVGSIIEKRIKELLDLGANVRSELEKEIESGQLFDSEILAEIDENKKNVDRYDYLEGDCHIKNYIEDKTLRKHLLN